MVHVETAHTHTHTTNSAGHPTSSEWFNHLGNKGGMRPLSGSWESVGSKSIPEVQAQTCPSDWGAPHKGLWRVPKAQEVLVTEDSQGDQGVGRMIGGLIPVTPHKGEATMSTPQVGKLAGRQLAPPEPPRQILGLFFLSSVGCGRLRGEARRVPSFPALS